MAASDVTSSFLCFLPEVHSEDIHKNFHHFSNEGSPSAVAKERTQAHYVHNSGVVATRGTSLLCNSNSLMEVELPSPAQHVETEFQSTGTSLEDTKAILQGIPNTSSKAAIKGSIEVCVETKITHVHKKEADYQKTFATASLPDIEDELAFEITQFFKAFEKGQEHLFATLKGDLQISLKRVSEQVEDSLAILDCSKHNLVAPVESLRSVKSGIVSNCGDDTNSNAVSLFHVNSARHSGHWYEELETGSLTTTSSGRLPSSGPIFYSGQSFRVSYSGSVSHRSDSSTGSTHSFAFPILQCEWNSSPVKMAQPDRKYRRQGWKSYLRFLFCCKGF